jgi:hypothetical protein
MLFVHMGNNDTPLPTYIEDFEQEVFEAVQENHLRLWTYEQECDVNKCQRKGNNKRDIVKPTYLPIPGYDRLHELKSLHKGQ